MGSIMGAWQLVYIGAAIPCGILLDRIGGRRALLLGAVLIALSGLGRALAVEYWTFLLAVMVFGLGGPIISSGAPKMVAELFSGSQRGLAMGIYMTGPAMGGVVSLALTNAWLMPLFDNNWRSGEIVLTASLGAAVGYVMLWWVLLSCWSKSLLQAEIARYVVLSGDTYIRALNRMPGKVPVAPGRGISWPVVVGLMSFVPGLTGLGGVIGGAGQAVVLLVPDAPVLWVVGALAVLVAWLLASGGYRRLEKLMLVLVVMFTVLTGVCAVLMQGTEFATRASDIAQGFSFEFPVEFAVLALAAYGYTGVNAGEISAYTYWGG
eukprot:g15561.t1